MLSCSSDPIRMSGIFILPEHWTNDPASDEWKEHNNIFSVLHPTGKSGREQESRAGCEIFKKRQQSQEDKSKIGRKKEKD